MQKYKITKNKKRHHKRNRRRRQRITLLLLILMVLATVLYIASQLHDSQNSIIETNPSGEILLVNQDNPLPKDYEVDLIELNNGTRVAQSMYPSLQQMFDDMRNEGYDPIVRSGYRSIDDQALTLDDMTQQYINQGYDPQVASNLAREYVLLPGFSEHQTGLCVDIGSESGNLEEDYIVYEWLIEHCADYGFILRYPDGKQDITGIGYEPWHYRYVGIELAQTITSLGITLEEYVENASN